MKIKILKNTILSGVYVKAGEIVDASDKDAAILIGYRKAEIYTTADEPVESDEQPADGEQSADDEQPADEQPSDEEAPEATDAPAAPKQSKKKK